MKYLIELGGENTKLGKIEVLELFSNENYKPKLEFEEKNICCYFGFIYLNFINLRNIPG